LDSQAAQGVSPRDVTHVIFSHLHFDHAGGATQYDENRRVRPTFPQARHWVHRWEWEDATSQSPELKAGYPSQNFLPLADAGLVDVYDTDGELLPGLSARLTGGHTRGHQALIFSADDTSLMFIGDVCPSSAHIRPQWHTAYDIYPLQSRMVKPRLLAEAAERKSWIVWNHDPTVAVSRVTQPRAHEFAIIDRLDAVCAAHAAG
jgi:glyoxylase-like metal-dependent hydrolase (beta-lactamase superfamily II)